jgi:hypothetical protein
VTAPLVAIPTYHLGAGQVGNWQGAYALPEPYVAALRAAGARTALLPPSQPAEPEELLAPFDGLLLAGGGDIEPARYGAAGHPAQYGTDPDRDELELELARAAARLGVPTLGICRGVQLLNVAFGGTLVQHLPDADGGVERCTGSGSSQAAAWPRPSGRSRPRASPTTTRAWTGWGRGSGRSPGPRTGWSRGSSARRAGRWGCSGIPRAPPPPTRSSAGCCRPSSLSHPGMDRDFGVNGPSR